MMISAFNIISTAISQCVEWVDLLFKRLGATMYVVSAIIIVLTVGLLLRPLRGGRISAVDFTMNQIHKSKKNKGG